MLRPLLTMLTSKPGEPPNSGLQELRVLRGVADVSARKERARDIIAESIMVKKTNLSGKCEGDDGGILNEWSTCPGTYILHKGAVLPEMTPR